jgi:hypothetical protein
MFHRGRQPPVSRPIAGFAADQPRVSININMPLL